MMKRKTESGFILIAAIIFSVVISILVLGIVARNSSQTVMAEKTARHIQAEQLAQGAFWAAHASLLNGASLPASFNETINGITYTITYSNTNDPLGNKITTTVHYQ